MKITPKIRYETLYQPGQPEVDSIANIIGIPITRANKPPRIDHFQAIKATASNKGENTIDPP
jgi:hypothetical protein